jgi:hypothetical protein
MGDEVSHLGGVQNALRHTAHELGAIAKGNLEAHRSESDRWGHARITVTRGDKLDWFVNLNDESSQSRRGGYRVRQRARRRRDRPAA